MLNPAPSVDISTPIRLLIVEDEYNLALNLQESLESLEYTVLDIVDSGAAAIEKAAELYPNLVLMDIGLRGDMDGVQAAEQIWNRLQIPVIYVTEAFDNRTVERAALTSPFGYLLKPVRTPELYVAIQTALSRYTREVFFSSILQAMGDGVVVVDPQLHIKYLNRAAETLTGWPLNDVKERPVTEVFTLVEAQTQRPSEETPPQDSLPERPLSENPLIAALQQETASVLRDGMVLINRQGASIPVTNSAAPLRNASGTITGAVLVMRDDTQRRLAEERNLALERARQIDIHLAEVQRLHQLKENFLAMTSHELRTPLSNIKLAIRLLETVLERQDLSTLQDEETAQSLDYYLTILRDQCDQELSLVNDLLDIRSIDADAFPLEFMPIQIQNWLPHIMEVFQERTQSQQQSLQISISPNLPPLVSDLPALNRIVSELVNNACKYTPSGGQIRVTVQLLEAPQTSSLQQPNGEWIQLQVSNSGVDIPVEERANIFEPFYRILQSDRWKYSGTGLGLALVKKLVEHLAGSIDVTSEPGWITFTLLLPINASPHATT